MYNPNKYNNGINNFYEYEGNSELESRLYSEIYFINNPFASQVINPLNMNDSNYANNYQPFNESNQIRYQQQNPYYNNGRDIRNYNSGTSNRFSYHNSFQDSTKFIRNQSGYHKQPSNLKNGQSYSKRHQYTSHKSVSPNSYRNHNYQRNQRSNNSSHHKKSSNYYNSSQRKDSYTSNDDNDHMHSKSRDSHRRSKSSPYRRPSSRNDESLESTHIFNFQLNESFSEQRSSRSNHRRNSRSSTNSSHTNDEIDSRSLVTSFSERSNVINQNGNVDDAMNVDADVTNQDNEAYVVENPVVESVETGPAESENIGSVDENRSVIVENDSSNVEVAVEDSTQEDSEPAEKQDKPPDSDKDDLGAESDSGDSILEIPVPPKPAPLLIDIQDSDEFSESEDDEEKEKEQPQSTDVEMNNTRNSNVSIDRTEEILEISSESEDVPQNRVLSIEDNEESVDSIETNIVLNCTGVQRGASSLNDIRKFNQNGNADVSNASYFDGENAEMIEQVADNSDVRETSRKTSNTPKKSKKHNESNFGKKSLKKRTNESFLEEENDNEENLNPSKRQKKLVKSTAEMNFDEYIFQPMPKYLQKFYTEPLNSDLMADVQLIQSQMPKHPNNWIILNADMVRSGSKSKRKRCANCQKDSHLRDRCPEKKKLTICHMCGQDGHMEPRCPYKMCLNCGTKYSTYRKTCEYCENLQCSSCNGVGHEFDNCPDFWRGYHQTTSGITLNIPEDPSKTIKPLKQLSCCNCARRGHDSSDCKQYRWSQHFPVSKNVTSYTNIPLYTPNIDEINNGDKEKLDLSTTDEPILETASNISIIKSTDNDNDDDDVDDDNDDDYNGDDVQLVGELNSTINQSTTNEYDTNKQKAVEIIKSSNATYKNCQGDKYNDWAECVINSRMRIETDVNLSFLQKQFPFKTNCFYDIIVKSSNVNDKEKNVQIIIKSPNLLLTDGFKRIIEQYISRTEIDKNFITNQEMLSLTNKKLLRQFISYKKKLINSTCELNLNFVSTIHSLEFKLRNEKNNEVKSKLMKILRKAKENILLAAHNYSIFPSAKSTIDQFNKLLDLLRLKKKKNEISPPSIKLLAVWVYFELFTAHLSPKMIKTILNWRKTHNNFESVKKLVNSDHIKDNKSSKNENAIKISKKQLSAKVNQLKEKIKYKKQNSPQEKPVRRQSERLKKMNESRANSSLSVPNNIQHNNQQIVTYSITTPIQTNPIVIPTPVATVASSLVPSTSVATVASSLVPSTPVATVASSLVPSTPVVTSSIAPSSSIRPNLTASSSPTISRLITSPSTVVKSSIASPTETPEGWEIFTKPLRGDLSKFQLLNYANAAMIFAQKHNLTNLIPEVENLVKNAKLFSVKTKQIVQIWSKLRSNVRKTRWS